MWLGCFPGGKRWAALGGFMMLLTPPAVQAEEPRSADLVVVDGSVVTMSDRQPRAEAVAALEGRLVAVGGNREIRRWVGPHTEVIRARGKLVTPGLIDSHVHLLGIGRSRQQLDLVGTSGQREIADLVRRRARKLTPGSWVLGRGWDQNDWPDPRFPTHRALTEAAPGRLVFLTRICGHAGWANRAALELAGIVRDTPDPPGGRILRDAEGEPTGVLIDAAQGLVAGKIPPPSKAEKTEALQLALAECLALGLTGIHDAGCGRETLAVLKQLADEGRLPLRVYVMLSGGDRRLVSEAFARGPEVGLGDHRLTVRAVKLFADGALGSRGAALLEPYADAPDESGLVILSGDQIARISQQALAAGFQVCTHAIGDRANRVTLDAYRRAFRALPDAGDPRFRIEHAQILDAADVPRFAELGVIASVQSTHATSDMPWVHDRIGSDRAREGAYLWQTLLDSGARICNGSDAPVERLDPLLGIYAAITRQDHAGHPPGGWYPRERMTRRRALQSFTLDGAHAAFEEDLKGSLEVGKLADLVVWSKNFLEVSPPEILTTHAETTVLGGRVVYRRAED